MGGWGGGGVGVGVEETSKDFNQSSMKTRLQKGEWVKDKTRKPELVEAGMLVVQQGLAVRFKWT